MFCPMRQEWRLADNACDLLWTEARDFEEVSEMDRALNHSGGSEK